jgi:hypothetical protein
MKSVSPTRVLRSLEEWALNSDNTFTNYLVPDSAPADLQHTTREVVGCHFVYVHPEPVSAPFFVVASPTCAESLGLGKETKLLQYYR